MATLADAQEVLKFIDGLKNLPYHQFKSKIGIILCGVKLKDALKEEFGGEVKTNELPPSTNIGLKAEQELTELKKNLKLVLPK